MALLLLHQCDLDESVNPSVSQSVSQSVSLVSLPLKCVAIFTLKSVGQSVSLSLLYFLGLAKGHQ
jgi:hypothetical protein